MLEFISSRDHRLMLRVNSWRPPQWIRVWMICATRSGDGWLWYVMLAGILLLGGEQRYAAVCSSATAAGLGILFFLYLKRKANRKRPCAIAEHCWSRLLPPDRFSFPSGHSITAFAVAVPLMFFYPPLMAGLLFCAISIAISRILLGMHFLSDVVAGCSLGLLLGYGCYRLYL